MTQEQINEGNKLIAERDAWEFRTDAAPCFFNGLREGYFKNRGDGLIMYCELENMRYHDNWSMQIPVWAKLVKQDMTSSGDWVDYHNAVDNEKPEAGFEILVSIIKRINHEQ